MKLVSDNASNSFIIKPDGAAGASGTSSDLYALIWPQSMDEGLPSLTDQPPTRLSTRAGKRTRRDRASNRQNVDDIKTAPRRMSMSHGRKKSIRQQSEQADKTIAEDAALPVDSPDKKHLPVGDSGSLDHCMSSRSAAAVATQSRSALVLYSEPWHLPQSPRGCGGFTVDEALLKLDTVVGLVLSQRLLERLLLPTKLAPLTKPLSLMAACDATYPLVLLHEQETAASASSYYHDGQSIVAQPAMIRVQDQQQLDTEELELSGAKKFYLIFCDRQHCQSSSLPAREKSEDAVCSIVITATTTSSSSSTTHCCKEDDVVDDNGGGNCKSVEFSGRSGSRIDVGTMSVDRVAAADLRRVRQLERRLTTAELLLARSQTETVAMVTGVMQTVSLQATLQQGERCNHDDDDHQSSQIRRRTPPITQVKRRRSLFVTGGVVAVVIIVACCALSPIRFAIQAAIDNEQAIVPF